MLLNSDAGTLFLSWFWIGKEVMAMLRLRAKDEKTNVRKSALQVWWFFACFPVLGDYPECR